MLPQVIFINDSSKPSGNRELRVGSLLPKSACARFPPGSVRLSHGLFRERRELVRKYALRLETDKIFQNHLLEAGVRIDTPCGELHRGWEEPHCQLRGHFAGHWLSAMSAFSAMDGDRIMESRVAESVELLKMCQERNGGLIPWYQTVKGLGLINSIWALVLGNSVPMFNVILVMNYIRGLPKELEEAAIVDGAGPWYILVKLIAPMSVPVFATVALFSIVFHWNEFFQGLVLISKSDHYPLQTYIQQMVVNLNVGVMSEDQYKKMNELSNQTLNAAKIFIAMIPVLCIYPFLQKYFINGITLGSVKE